jgi:hypothetical protein
MKNKNLCSGQHLGVLVPCNFSWSAVFYFRAAYKFNKYLMKWSCLERNKNVVRSTTYGLPFFVRIVGVTEFWVKDSNTNFFT